MHRRATPSDIVPPAVLVGVGLELHLSRMVGPKRLTDRTHDRVVASNRSPWSTEADLVMAQLGVITTSQAVAQVDGGKESVGKSGGDVVVRETQWLVVWYN